MLPAPRGWVHQRGRYLRSAAARKILPCHPSPLLLLLPLGVSYSHATGDVLSCPRVFPADSTPGEHSAALAVLQQLKVSAVISS